MAASPQKTDNGGAEIYLYPNSEADISAYGRCAHMRNTTPNTVVAFAVTPAAWPESKSLTSEQGAIVMKVTECK